MMAKDAKIEIERDVRTFANLYHGSLVLLERSKDYPEGGYYALLGSMLFTAFTFEAFLNHLGKEKIEDWERIDREPVMKKYSVLCDKFDITRDPSRRPYQTLKNLFGFRDNLAHGRTEKLQVNKNVNIKDDILSHTPKTKWEKYCNEENAVRARADVERVIVELNQAAGGEKDPFTMGMTVSTMSSR
ncbi:hypothetical protein JR334_02095 [Clostridia bacterium]|nr:hypothetical protein JR334_02095 [Clostridia bacterium]